MAIPILNYAFSTQNQRVNGFETRSGDEQPKIYTTNNFPTAAEMDAIIWAAYRQIFSEHQILRNHINPFLESQLRFNQIKVKEFIKGLLLSNSFRKLNFDENNNYRFVELCVQRILGRDVYNEREKIAFSIIVASEGLEKFFDFLLECPEYIENFGESTVPYQRRRIIFQRIRGEMPFNLKTPRTARGFFNKANMSQLHWSGIIRQFRPQERTPRAGDPALFLAMANEVC